MNRERERLIERVQKLFALSRQNDSPDEAQAAAMKARELLVKYDLSLSEVELRQEGPENCSEHRITRNGLKTPTWIKLLHGAVAEGFGVQKFRGLTAFNTVLGYIGVEPDVTIAKQTFEYLHDFVCKYTLEDNGAKYKNQWRIGFACGISRRFEEQKREQEKGGQTSGLVLAKEQIAQDFIRAKGYEIKPAPKLPEPKYTKAFYKGIKVGMETPINRPLEE